MQRVRVNATANATDASSGWTDLTVSSPAATDLLTLRNGQTAPLGQVSLPVGHYASVEVVLAQNTGTSAPFANSVTATGSGTASGLMNLGGTATGTQVGWVAPADITITAGQTTSEVVEIDACRSIARDQASGQYYLTPAITVVPAVTTGVTAMVDPTLANGNTRVTLQQGGRIVAATSPDTTGQFTLDAPAGTYDLVITAPGRSTAVVTGVTVAGTGSTSLQGSTPITLATAATTGTAAGTVTTSAGGPIGASVDVMQTLANGDVVDVAGQPVDAGNGTYAYTLSAGAPMVATWNAGNTLTFAADTTAGNTYLLSATSGTTTKTGGPITVTSGGTTTTDFGF